MKYLLLLLIMPTAFSLHTFDTGETISHIKVNDNFTENKVQSGQIVGSYYTDVVNIVEGSSLQIADDDSKPEVTEGYQVFSINYQPKRIGNYIIVESRIHIAEAANQANTGILSIFETSIDPIYAIGVGVLKTQNASNMLAGQIRGVKKIDISSLDPMPIQIRVGVEYGTLHINKQPKESYVSPFHSFGGLLSSDLKITEYYAE